MFGKKKKSLYGQYPSNDMLNNAIRFILSDKPNLAIEEIVYAISKADGQLCEDVKEQLLAKGIMTEFIISMHKTEE